MELFMGTSYQNGAFHGNILPKWSFSWENPTKMDVFTGKSHQNGCFHGNIPAKWMFSWEHPSKMDVFMEKKIPKKVEGPPPPKSTGVPRDHGAVRRVHGAAGRCNDHHLAESAWRGGRTGLPCGQGAPGDAGGDCGDDNNLLLWDTFVLFL